MSVCVCVVAAPALEFFSVSPTRLSNGWGRITGKEQMGRRHAQGQVRPTGRAHCVFVLRTFLLMYVPFSTSAPNGRRGKRYIVDEGRYVVQRLGERTPRKKNSAGACAFQRESSFAATTCPLQDTQVKSHTSHAPPFII